MNIGTLTLANESAFPAPSEFRSDGALIVYANPGLTKREHFAAMAMQGICGDGIPGSHHHPVQTARDAVAQADALLAELAKVQS